MKISACLEVRALGLLASLWLVSTFLVLIQVNSRLVPTLNDIPSIEESQRSNSDSAFMEEKPHPLRIPPLKLTSRYAGDDLPHDKLTTLWKDILVDLKRPPDEVFNVNVSQSEQIPLRRPIPETRPEICLKQDYNVSSLPQSSVIIPVYNEALSLLLRTIHSILDRTPASLLQEIILVDDASTHEDLGEPLDRYLELLGDKVQLVRNFQRQGLIRSRLHGMQLSRAPIIVFLDAHVEVNVGWLEPLLVQLQMKPDTVVQPFVDGVDPQTLVYSAPMALYRGGLTWDLRYVWIRLPQHIQEAANAKGQPYWTSTLIGCAFAVNKTYFKHIGAFDADQMIWGGENVELSLRTWMCGGTILTVPCSRLGHVFRPTPYKKESPFQITWQKNLIRTAEVWLGPYKKYFYASTGVYQDRRINLTTEEWTSLHKRISLRDKLKCKSFDWFLHDIAPDMLPPPRHSVEYGEITNFRTEACWKVLDDGFLAMDYMCWEHRVIVENIFSLTKDGLLMYGDKCVVYDFPSPSLKVQECPEKPSVNHLGVWYMTFGQFARWGQLKVDLKVNGKVKTVCISQVTSVVLPHLNTQMPQVNKCDASDPFQIWSFTYRLDYKNVS